MTTLLNGDPGGSLFPGRHRSKGGGGGCRGQGMPGRSAPDKDNQSHNAFAIRRFRVPVSACSKLCRGRIQAEWCYYGIPACCYGIHVKAWLSRWDGDLVESHTSWCLQTQNVITVNLQSPIQLTLEIVLLIEDPTGGATILDHVPCHQKYVISHVNFKECCVTYFLMSYH